MAFWNKEEWEKDFTGLEKWLTVSVSQLDKYIAAAELSDVRLESKKLNDRIAELWVVPDCDKEEFWKAYNQLK